MLTQHHPVSSVLFPGQQGECPGMFPAPKAFTWHFFTQRKANRLKQDAIGTANAHQTRQADTRWETKPEPCNHILAAEPSQSTLWVHASAPPNLLHVTAPMARPTTGFNQGVWRGDHIPGSGSAQGPQTPAVGGPNKHQAGPIRPNPPQSSTSKPLFVAKSPTLRLDSLNTNLFVGKTILNPLPPCK